MLLGGDAVQNTGLDPRANAGTTSISAWAVTLGLGPREARWGDEYVQSEQASVKAAPLRVRRHSIAFVKTLARGLAWLDP